MKNLFKYLHVLRDTAGGAEGGGGTGSLLTGLAGGGQNNAPAGQQGAGNPPTPTPTPPGNGDKGGSPQGNPPQDWRSSLSTELREDPSIKLFTDINGLAKSYINAQKMVGADKIVVPGKHATEDDYRAVYEKLGLPKDIKEYEVKMKEGVSIDKDFVEKFKGAAHKAGILPKQAQAVADWFAEVNSASEAEIAKQSSAVRAEKLEGLKKEWGNAYTPKLEQAAQVLREFGNPELYKHLDETHLGDDPQVIKLLASIHDKYMKEDTGDKGGNNNLNPTMTPAEAQKAHSLIMGDMKHPYYDASHPNHKAAVAEVAGLFAMAHPQPKK